MMSRDPNPNNFTDDEFEQDIADLLGDFGSDGERAESDSELNELVSLFDEDLGDLSEHRNEQKTTATSSVPANEDLKQLFSEDFILEDENTPAKSGTSQVKPIAGNELGELLGYESESESDSSFFRRLESSLEPVATESRPENCKQLLETDKSLAKSLSGSDFCFYPVLEALEEFVAQPAIASLQDSLDETQAKALEVLIDTPVNLPQSLTTVTVQKTVQAIPSGTASQHATEPEFDEEFRDLEALLEQADRTMGGSPTVTPANNKRFPRAAKVKVFEQTMRVPVKQLDNLSNLIGELVVKRNRLEQDQERLRQFLDNLLNQVQNLSDVGGRMQDLYERTLLEGALLASRERGRSLNDRRQPDAAKPIVEADENARCEAVPEGIAQDLDALEMDRFTGFHLLSQEMIELIVRVREASSDIQFLVDETEQVARSLRQATTQLQEGMTKSRMVPFAQTADRLPRAVREISLKLNKQARLQVEGREALIDKMILEHLYNPMTHLVNNAITHGIESPAVRQQQGKSPEGQVAVRAFLQGNQTVITVSDDGGGIDAQLVKTKAVEKGLVTTEEAQILTTQEIYDFLFHPGFSTRDKADDFAGRGVGLDVVRTSLTDIRGSVTIDSTPGKGTTFTIRLPLTLSICKALCCLNARARIAFPMDGVEDMKDFSAKDIVINEEGQKCIRWDNSLLPIYPLGELLTYNRLLSRGSVYGGKPEEDTISTVILRGAGNWLAIQVDGVIGEQEIVIKQIEGPVPKPPGIAGATVLGDGSIMPIGDVLELLEIAQGRLRTDGAGSFWKKAPIAPSVPLSERAEPTVLIVDDSITVRELLSLSFSKAGYRVEQARDGQEAWEKLRSGLPCDIVFCDIEMPRMNGLELLSNLQKDRRLSEIPVALLTSRGADRHRKVAAKLGASAYFTKPCPDGTLLDAAQRMLQGEVLLAGSFKPSRVPSQNDTPNQSSAAKGVGNRVLIVDDSVMVREMLSMTFGKAGYHIEQARDGQEAWEKLRAGLGCDLILCDIEMPRMNGLELLSRLQEDATLSQIPMAMITSRGAQKMQRLAAENGAKGYFVKPYIEEVLLDATKRLLAGEVLLDINSLVEG